MMAAGAEREMLLSGSESSANSDEDSVKRADGWSVHMWCRFSYGAALRGQAFEFGKASNNNFSKRYHTVHTRSDLSVRKPSTAVSHPASIGVSPVCLGTKKKYP